MASSHHSVDDDHKKKRRTISVSTTSSVIKSLGIKKSEPPNTELEVPGIFDHCTTLSDRFLKRDYGFRPTRKQEYERACKVQLLFNEWANALVENSPDFEDQARAALEALCWSDITPNSFHLVEDEIQRITTSLNLEGDLTRDYREHPVVWLELITPISSQTAQILERRFIIESPITFRPEEVIGHFSTRSTFFDMYQWWELRQTHSITGALHLMRLVEHIQRHLNQAGNMLFQNRPSYVTIDQMEELYEIVCSSLKSSPLISKIERLLAHTIAKLENEEFLTSFRRDAAVGLKPFKPLLCADDFSAIEDELDQLFPPRYVPPQDFAQFASLRLIVDKFQWTRLKGKYDRADALRYFRSAGRVQRSINRITNLLFAVLESAVPNEFELLHQRISSCRPETSSLPELETALAEGIHMLEDDQPSDEISPDWALAVSPLAHHMRPADYSDIEQRLDRLCPPRPSPQTESGYFAYLTLFVDRYPWGDLIAVFPRDQAKIILRSAGCIQRYINIIGGILYQYHERLIVPIHRTFCECPVDASFIVRLERRMTIEWDRFDADMVFREKVTNDPWMILKSKAFENACGFDVYSWAVSEFDKQELELKLDSCSQIAEANLQASGIYTGRRDFANQYSLKNQIDARISEFKFENDVIRVQEHLNRIANEIYRSLADSKKELLEALYESVCLLKIAPHRVGRLLDYMTACQNKADEDALYRYRVMLDPLIIFDDPQFDMIYGDEIPTALKRRLTYVRKMRSGIEPLDFIMYPALQFGPLIPVSTKWIALILTFPALYVTSREQIHRRFPRLAEYIGDCLNIWIMKAYDFIWWEKPPVANPSPANRSSNEQVMSGSSAT